MATTISGLSGELRWGYLPAATLGRWTSEGRLVRAPLLSSNSVYLARRPLTLRLALGARTFQWDGVDVAVVGGRVMVTLPDSPQE